MFGKNAYGTVKLAGQEGPRIYVKDAKSGGTSNPLEIYSTVGWKAFFAVKTLNANWLINMAEKALCHLQAIASSKLRKFGGYLFEAIPSQAL